MIQAQQSLDDQFWTSVRSGDLTATLELLGKRPGMVSLRTGPDSSTALHYAALSNRLDVAACLLDHQAPAGAQDADGSTAVALAARAGHRAMVELLLRHGAVGSESRLGDDGRGDTRGSSRGSSRGAGRGSGGGGGGGGGGSAGEGGGIRVEAAAVADKRGYTAFLWGCQMGRAGVVADLIALTGGACLGETTAGTAETGLHVAVSYDHEEVVALLLDAGGGAAAKDMLLAANAGGRSPLCLAAKHKRLPIFKRLAKADRALLGGAAGRRFGPACLFLAAEHGAPKILLLLVRAYKLDVDMVDPLTGDPLIKCAALAGHAAVVRALLSRGASPVLPDRQGLEPAHFAAMRGHGECLGALESAK